MSFPTGKTELRVLEPLKTVERKEDIYLLYLFIINKNLKLVQLVQLVYYRVHYSRGVKHTAQFNVEWDHFFGPRAYV